MRTCRLAPRCWITLKVITSYPFWCYANCNAPIPVGTFVTRPTRTESRTSRLYTSLSLVSKRSSAKKTFTFLAFPCRFLVERSFYQLCWFPLSIHTREGRRWRGPKPGEKRSLRNWQGENFCSAVFQSFPIELLLIGRIGSSKEKIADRERSVANGIWSMHRRSFCVLGYHSCLCRLICLESRFQRGCSPITEAFW